MKHLLIVYHTKTGNTGRLADAAYRGASSVGDADVAVRFITARRAGAKDLLWADGLLLGTPENLGYMSGAMKDFLDRTFYEVEGKLQPLPCAIFISAGNDGSGALSAIRRIMKGYPFEEVQEALVVQGPIQPEHLERCEELGMALAVGLDAGIY
ncbi:MAG: NAD(P)H-dependent oxidoreductase [Gammaproteobacteria bacterium]|nr:NAD(P)H-dependent oxidoreductase [Gammaproteobacteria bacterium]